MTVFVVFDIVELMREKEAKAVTSVFSLSNAVFKSILFHIY